MLRFSRRLQEFPQINENDCIVDASPLASGRRDSAMHMGIRHLWCWLDLFFYSKHNVFVVVLSVQSFRPVHSFWQGLGYRWSGGQSWVCINDVMTIQLWDWFAYTKFKGIKICKWLLCHLRCHVQTFTLVTIMTVEKRGRYFYSQRKIFSCNTTSCHWGKTELKLGWVHSIAAHTQRGPTLLQEWRSLLGLCLLSPPPFVFGLESAVVGQSPSCHSWTIFCSPLKPRPFPKRLPDWNPASSLPCSSTQSGNLWKNGRSTNSQTALWIILPRYTVYLFPFLLLSPPLGSKFT